LKNLLELPKGKILGHFDCSDTFKVKEIIGNHMCIMGNVSPSVLNFGLSDDVIASCMKLIDVVGKNGGYIMSSRAALDDAKPENVKAMIDFT
jgi:uroporphyrinogen-III decarboxylase